MEAQDGIMLTRGLSEAMAARGLGVPELADVIGVAPDDVRSVLAGHLRFVEDRVLRRIQAWLADERTSRPGPHGRSPRRPRRPSFRSVSSVSSTS